jgi:hypothetical protein
MVKQKPLLMFVYRVIKLCVIGSKEIDSKVKKNLNIEL